MSLIDRVVCKEVFLNLEEAAIVFLLAFRHGQQDTGISHNHEMIDAEEACKCNFDVRVSPETRKLFSKQVKKCLPFALILTESC